MAQYMLLLRAEGRVEDINHPADTFDQMVAWATDLHQRKILLGANPLMRSTAKTLRHRKGTFVIDGPFAEGKEAVLGYFIITANSHAEAVEVFKSCPSLKFSGECAEVVELGKFPQFS